MTLLLPADNNTNLQRGFMITFLYAAILALLLIWLIIKVVKARLANQVKLGDGGVEELISARSAHSNACETIPITLILLLGLEFNGASVLLIHLCAIVFVIARILHAQGVLTDILKIRKLGMQLTLLIMLALVVLNIVYLPYDQLLP